MTITIIAINLKPWFLKGSAFEGEIFIWIWRFRYIPLNKIISYFVFEKMSNTFWWKTVSCLLFSIKSRSSRVTWSSLSSKKLLRWSTSRSKLKVPFPHSVHQFSRDAPPTPAMVKVEEKGQIQQSIICAKKFQTHATFRQNAQCVCNLVWTTTKKPLSFATHLHEGRDRDYDVK